MPTDRFALSLLMLAVLACGCSSSPARKDLVAAHVLKLDQLPSDRYELSPPQITRDQDGVVTFTGEVKRKPGDDGATDEHLHLDILDPKGEWVDQIALHWQPQAIPKDGTRSAAYEVSYFWEPPAGTTVRVSIADDSHDTSLGSGGGSVSAGPTVPGVPGQPKGPNTPTPGGSPRQGATRTPMQPRQPSQPRTPGVPLGRGSSHGHR